MAILGTLSLDVSAPTAQLQRDLERAQQMVRESARQMDNIKPTWGIASSLQDELRASRSIFNNYAKSIESDAKGYTPKIITTIEINTADYLGKLQSLEREFSQRIGKLNNFKIEPQVDDKQLTALNAHLSLKQKHYNEVLETFSKPITPSFIEGKMSGQDNSFNQQNRSSNQQNQSFNQGNRQNTEPVVQEISVKLPSIKLPSQGNIISAIVSPFASIIRGAFEGLGREMFGGIAKSFSATIAGSLGDVIGSGDLVGKKIGQYVGKNAQIYGALAMDQSGMGNMSQVGDEIRSALGEKDVAIEINAIRKKAQEKDRSKLKDARIGVVGEMSRAADAADQADERFYSVGKENTPKAKALAAKQTTLGLAANILTEKINTTREAKDDNSDSKTPEQILALSSKELKLLAAKRRLDKKINDTEKELDQIIGAIEYSQADRFVQGKKYNTVRKQADLLKEDRLPENVQAIIDEMAPSLPEDQIPRLVSSFKPDEMGANAAYQAAGNRILLNPDLYKRINSGKELSGKDYRTIREELEHAKDFKFGRFDGFQAASEYRLPASSVNQGMTLAEEEEVAPDLLNYSEKERAIERNAKVRRNRAYKKEITRRELAFVEKQGGTGGVKLATKAQGVATISADVTKELRAEANEGKVTVPVLAKLDEDGLSYELKADALKKRIMEASVGDLSPKETEELALDIQKFNTGLQNLSKRTALARTATANMIAGVSIKGDKVEKYKPKFNAKRAATEIKEGVSSIGDKVSSITSAVKSSFSGSIEPAQEGDVEGQTILPQGIQNALQFAGQSTRVAGSVGGAVGRAALPVAKAARATYNMAEGVESKVLPFVPFGRQIKSVGKNVALPALLYNALPMAGSAGQALQMGLGGGLHDLLSMATGGMLDAAVTGIGGSVSSVPMIGEALGQAGGALAAGALDSTIGAAVPILAGKTVLGGISGAINAMSGGKQSKAQARQQKQLGSDSVTGTIAAAQKAGSMVQKLSGVSVEYEQLNQQIAGQGFIPQIEQAGSSQQEETNAIVPATRRSIAAIWSTNNKPVNPVSNRRVSETIGQKEGVSPDTNKFVALREQAKDSISRLKSNLQSAIDQQDRSAASRLISQIADEIEIFKEYNAANKGMVSKGKQGSTTRTINRWEKERAEMARVVEVIPETDPTDIRRDETLFSERRSEVLFSERNRPSRQTKASTTASPSKGVDPITPPVPPRPLLGVPLDTNTVDDTPDKEFAYTLIDQIKAANPFRRKSTQRIQDDPIAAAKETASRIGDSLDRYNSAEQRIKDRERNSLIPNNPGNYGGGSTPLGDATEAAKNKLEKLGNAGKLILGGFAGFTALSLGVPAMIALGKATFDTAANFERLQVKLAGATDSAASGKAQFAKLSNTADRMGISRSTALETGASVLGTTFGTELEGGISDKINTQILQLGQSRGLSQVESKGTLLALKQMLGKSRISTEEINQLTESGGISDARAIGARSLGMSPVQFTKTLEGSTGIDSKSFVQKFLAQANQDALSGKALAQDSVGFKQERVGAAIERTSGTIGAAALTPVKAALDLFTSALDLLNKGLEKSAGLLIGVGVASLGMLGQAAITSGTALNSSIMMVSQSIKGLNLSAGSMAQSFGKMALQMGLIAVAGETLRLVADQFKNVSQDLIDATGRLGQATRDANISKDKQIEGKPQSADQIGGKDWAESALLGLQRGYRALDNAAGGVLQAVTGKRFEPTIDTKEKEANDRTVAIGDFLTKSQSVRAQTEPTIEKSKGLKQIDLELNTLDTERSGLFANGDADQGKVSELNKRYQAKVAERDKLNQDITPQKTDVQEAINAAKGELKNLEEQFGKGQIAQPQYVSAITSIRAEIKALEADQIKLNEAIKSGFDNLTPWLTSLAKIAAKFEDIGIAANTSKERFAVARNNAEIGGRVTRGGSERQSVEDNDRITEAEIKARKSAISEMESKLNALNPNNVTNVRKDYNLTENSSSAEIKVALGGASSASDKVTLEKLAVIKDEQLKVASLDAGLSNSHAETYRRIFAENREAALYYTSLAQQIDPSGAAFAKSIANISAEKNKFMSKLNNYGSSGFDAYATAVIELMDVAKDRMAAQAKLASDKKAAIDAKTNRTNEIQGKNLNAFDSVPGSIQPSKPFVTSGKTPKPKVQKNKSTKVSKPATTSPYTAEIPSGYSPQGALAGQFARKKAEKATKVKAPKAVTTKPLKAPKPVKPVTPPKSKIAKPSKPQTTSPKLKAVEGTDPYINILSAPQFKETKALKAGKVTKPVKTPKPKTTKAPKAPISINSAKPAKAVKLPKPKGTGAGGRVTTVDFNNASQDISGMIANQATSQSQNDFAVSEGNNKLREQQAIQKLEKDGRLAQQAADKLIRDNELAMVTATATPSIQSQQRRETLQQQSSFTDTRNDIANKGYDMASGINNAQVAIDTLAAIQNRNPEQESAYRKAVAALPAMVASLQQLQDQQARLPEIEAAAAAQLAKNQAYALEVSKENEQQERRRAEKSAVQTKLTGVQQQISLTPLDQNKLLEARKLESDIANRQTEIDKVAAKRTVSDRARQDDSYSPAAQAADARRIAADQANNRKNIKDKQAQESIKSGRTARDEGLGNKAAEDNLKVSDEAQTGRLQQANDKIDAPFANTISLESDLKQKLLAIKATEKEKLKTLTQMKEKFAGTSTYNAEQLASIDRQEKEVKRQSIVDTSIAETEAGVSIRSVQKDRRGYLKGQEQQLTSGKISLYDSQTNSTKQQGGDVTDREFKSNVAKRMEDTNVKVSDLEQQRSVIVGKTTEANAAREAIDKLIASHYQLEQSDLSNMASAYDKFNQVLGDTQKTAMSVLETFVKTGKFDWRALLISPLESSIKQLLGNVVPNLFSGLFRKVEAPTKREGVVDSIITNTKPSLNEFYSKPSLGDGVKVGKPEGDSPYANISAKPELADPKGDSHYVMAPTKPLDMVEIPIPGGGKYKVTRQQAISKGFINPKKEVRPDKPKPEIRKPESDEPYLNKVAAPLPARTPATPVQSIGTTPIGKKSASSEMVDITMQDGTVKQMTRSEAIFNDYMSANEVAKPKLEIPKPISDTPFVQSNKDVTPVIKKSQPAIQRKVEKAIEQKVEQKVDNKFDNDLNNFNFNAPEEPKEIDRKWIQPQVIEAPKPKKQVEGRLKKTDTIMFSGGGAPAVEIPWGEKKEIPTPELEIKPFKPQTIDPPEVTIRDYGEVKGKGENLLKGTDLDNNYNKTEIIPAPSKILDPSRPMIPFDGLEKRSAAPRQGNSLGGGILNVASSLISGKGIGGVLGSLGGLFGLSFADGGIVPNDPKFNKFREGDNPVANALRKEGTNSVIAALTPGERVLTVSESKYYQTMFPKGIKNFKDGGVVGEIKPVAMALDQRKIDTRGDSNEFNFNISDGSGNQKQGGMSKSDVKDFENAVTAVMLKHKRARTGLTG